MRLELGNVDPAVGDEPTQRLAQRVERAVAVTFTHAAELKDAHEFTLSDEYLPQATAAVTALQDHARVDAAVTALQDHARVDAAVTALQDHARVDAAVTALQDHALAEWLT